MSTKVFQPVIKVAKARAAKVDLSTCLGLANRSRGTDILILCCGIGIGVLLYALVHDLVLRLQPADRTECTCSSMSSSSPHAHAHSHHLLSASNQRFLLVPASPRPVLADEKV